MAKVKPNNSNETKSDIFPYDIVKSVVYKTGEPIQNDKRKNLRFHHLKIKGTKKRHFIPKILLKKSFVKFFNK